MRTNIVPDPRQYAFSIVRALASQHWTALRLPAGGRLVNNRQRLILRTSTGDRCFRLHLYTITGSGRQNPSERRIEITSTYAKGMKRLPGFLDVVLGFDPETDVLVGFDNRRLDHGGPTGNASSFFPEAGLTSLGPNSLSVISRGSDLFGTEYHAFFHPPQVAEYLLNVAAVHSGTFVSGGPGSGHRSSRPNPSITVPKAAAVGDDVVLAEPSSPPMRRRVNQARVLEAETGHRIRRSVSPQELERILRRAAENGEIGEQLVLASETKRLRALGRPDLAETIQWTSQIDATAGYDIRSIELDGRQKYIEVKSTQGSGSTFPMSVGEWHAAEVIGDCYVIARVRGVRSEHPSIDWYRDPVQLEALGRISRRARDLLVTVT